MRGRLSIVDLAGTRGLVPDIRRASIAPSIKTPAARVIEGRTPRLNAAGGKPFKWAPRRWAPSLSDDLEPIIPRAMPEISLTPLVAPVLTPSASTAAPSGGFWSGIASGLSQAVQGILPSLAQVGAARVMTTQQAALLRQQGQQLYTPANINTLMSQAQFEAAQRQVEQGRQLGTTSLPLSGTALALIGGAGLVLYLAMRKK